MLKAAKQKDGSYHFDEVFARAQGLFDEADILVGNLETPLAGEAALYTQHYYAFNAPDAYADAVKKAGLASVGVGKIHDIFAGRGLTEHVYNQSNAHGMEHAMHYADQEFEGLCFVNLVDFDMQFGHRRNIDGYAQALTEFDTWLGNFLPTLGEEDLVMAPTRLYMQRINVDGSLGVKTEIELVKDNLDVFVEGRSIVAPVDAEIYTINGIRVASENLLPGVYVVCSGGKTVKVAIK